MNLKRFAPIAATLILFCMFLGVAAYSVDFGADVVTIQDTTKATDRYLPVSFNHKGHIEGYGISCVTCHHKESESFTSGSTPKCSSCHNAESTVSFKESMHKRCVVCHITENKNGKSAPTECLACHTQRP